MTPDVASVEEGKAGVLITCPDCGQFRIVLPSERAGAWTCACGRTTAWMDRDLGVGG